MTTEEQLAWEERAGRPAAATLFASVLLSFAALIYLPAAVNTGGTTDLDRVVTIVHHPEPFLVAAALQGLATVLLPVGLLYLDRATKFRSPARPPVAVVVSVAGPLLAAAGGVALQIDLNNLASDALPLSERGAHDLLREGISAGVRGLAQGGGVALGIAFALVALNAMRAGLLSRFMGILGIVLGALSVLTALAGGSASGGFIQFFWVAALGALVARRWPGGRGPAWETGEAIPWPSAAERAAAQTRDEQKGTEPSGTEPAEEATAADHPRSRKRKRKRRR